MFLIIFAIYCNFVNFAVNFIGFDLLLKTYFNIFIIINQQKLNLKQKTCLEEDNKRKDLEAEALEVVPLEASADNNSNKPKDLEEEASEELNNNHKVVLGHSVVSLVDQEQHQVLEVAEALAKLKHLNQEAFSAEHQPRPAALEHHKEYKVVVALGEEWDKPQLDLEANNQVKLVLEVNKLKVLVESEPNHKVIQEVYSVEEVKQLLALVPVQALSKDLEVLNLLLVVCLGELPDLDNKLNQPVEVSFNNSNNNQGLAEVV